MTAFRVAAALLWIAGVGFGVPILPAIRSIRAGRGIPTFMGFPAYGHGPFERHGIQTTLPLLAMFLLLCLLECWAGWLLWSGRRMGGILAVDLVPVGAVFWWGFALPIPPMFAIVRTILIVVSWRSLR